MTLTLCLGGEKHSLGGLSNDQKIDVAVGTRPSGGDLLGGDARGTQTRSQRRRIHGPAGQLWPRQGVADRQGGGAAPRSGPAGGAILAPGGTGARPQEPPPQGLTAAP